MKQTRSIKKAEVTQEWYLIDASNVRLGLLASEVAKKLLGKDKVDYAENLGNGDAVVIVNAAKVDVHKSKLTKKKYYRHSGYISGMTEKTLEEMLEDSPERVIEKAVRGMLPKNKLGEQLFSNLFVYEGEDHPHQGQKPTKIKVK